MPERQATTVPVQERFTPGQTVWEIGDHGAPPFRVSRWTDEESLILIDSKGYLRSGNFASFTATDPNAKPQKCPFCGRQPEVQMDLSYVFCQYRDCGFVGPTWTTREEAIAAWNRIRVGLTAAQAAALSVCRICEGSTKGAGPLTLNYGKEYAHTACLKE